ncbi:MAG TPA: hypothetical protein VMH05_06150 [Bryobacteraceae bacterium]|nr:hypothetical protein [Bryobacteraceae bacterium]
MGSISSANPSLTSLLQTLSSIDTSLVSSPSVAAALQGALQKASPADVVQLSAAANQLENVGLMFGQATGPSDSSDTTDLTNLFASLETPTAQSTDQAASDHLATLLGSEPTGASNSLFNLLG